MSLYYISDIKTDNVKIIPMPLFTCLRSKGSSR